MTNIKPTDVYLIKEADENFQRTNEFVIEETGMELIKRERHEQIHKHGFSVENDFYYSKKELVQAAEYCLMLAGYIDKNVFWPDGWDAHFEHKILNKSEVQKMIVAGAFLMA